MNVLACIIYIYIQRATFGCYFVEYEIYRLDFFDFWEFRPFYLKIYTGKWSVNFPLGIVIFTLPLTNTLQTNTFKLYGDFYLKAVYIKTQSGKYC